MFLFTKSNIFWKILENQNIARDWRLNKVFGNVTQQENAPHEFFRHCDTILRKVMEGWFEKQVIFSIQKFSKFQRLPHECSKTCGLCWHGCFRPFSQICFWFEYFLHKTLPKATYNYYWFLCITTSSYKTMLNMLACVIHASIKMIHPITKNFQESPEFVVSKLTKLYPILNSIRQKLTMLFFSLDYETKQFFCSLKLAQKKVTNSYITEVQPQKLHS